MKRVVVDHYGGPEVLKIVEEDAPRPAMGEVRVKVLHGRPEAAIHARL
jgi:NADPH:quinone reductase